MEWFAYLERRKRSVLILLSLLLVATLAVSSMRGPKAYDAYWHLKMGEDWVERDISPWRDSYSFTFSGEDIQSPPVWFEASLYWTVKHLGLEPGFKVYKFAAILLALFLSMWWLHRIRAPVVVYCLVLPLVVSALQLRATVRPELISYSLSIIALALYDRARTGISARNILPIVILMVVWTNYHSSIIGYVIFFGLFVDYGLQQWAERAAADRWVKWLAWGGLLVAVGFLNPSFSHPLIAMLAFPAEWKDLIQEYRSTAIYLNSPAFYALLIAVALTLVLLLRQRQFGLFIVSAILVFNASTVSRVVTPTAVVVLGIFALTLTRADLGSWLQSVSPARRRLLAAVTLVLFLVPLLHNVLNARAFVRENFGLIGYFPEQLVDFMIDNRDSGRIFNDYGVGGYLIYRLSPGHTVYIDGRTNILYPLSHMQKYLEAMQSATVMKSEIEKYAIDYAILPNKAAHAALMARVGLLQLDFADVRYFLYSKGNANFPVAGQLWGQPYCWKEVLADSLSGEQAMARFLLPPASPLLPFLDVMTGYENAADRNLFLAGDEDTQYWSDSTRRFAGYRALSNGLYDLARGHFRSVKVKEQKDYLAEALALLRAGDPAGAENLLDTATKIQWANLDFIDFVILEALLREIQAAGPLKKFAPEYLEHLATEVGEYALSGPDKRLRAETFCADLE